MIVNRIDRFVFLHAPKTAGTSITKELLNRHGSAELGHKHANIRCLKNKWPDEFEFFKFTFVRNPWDRLLSHFHWVQQLAMPRNSYYHHIINKSFDEYVKSIKDGAPCLPNSHRFTHIDDRQVVDFIGYYENLGNDFDNVKKEIGLIDIKLSHHNKSKHDDYRDCYTDETRKIIGDTFAKDIELFGYTFEGRE